MLLSSFYFIHKYSPTAAIARGIQKHFNTYQHNPERSHVILILKKKKTGFLDTLGKSFYI